MLVKSYWSSWIVFAVMAGIFVSVGAFTMLVAVVFGFIAFGLVFIGMMCVLPGEVSHMAVKQIKVLTPNKVFVISDSTVEFCLTRLEPIPKLSIVDKASGRNGLHLSNTVRSLGIHRNTF